ncbi:MAG: hypothetical protein WC551_12090 [Patescibacteria group bacterium]
MQYPVHVWLGAGGSGAVALGLALATGGWVPLACGVDGADGPPMHPANNNPIERNNNSSLMG